MVFVIGLIHIANRLVVVFLLVVVVVGATPSKRIRLRRFKSYRDEI